MQIKLNKLMYFGIGLAYFGLVLFLVSMIAGTGLADNSTDNSTVLKSVITEASSILGGAVPGTEVGQYPQSAIDTFNAAIATAQAVVNNTNATPAEIDQAIKDLRAAEKIFTAAKITTVDRKPPSSVTNLRETVVGSSWIRWTWVNPKDSDFSHIMVYIDGVFVKNTSGVYYNATGLAAGTTHTISTKTVDISGNINPALVADSATTKTVNVDLVSHFGGSINDVAVAGNYAYIGQGQDFVVLDIADVDNPSEAGRIVTPSVVIGVTVSGNYAYVADGSSGLIIIDITNPSSPTITGDYDTAGHAYGIVVSGNYAYVADAEGGLLIVDVTNHAAPTLKGSYNTGSYANDVAVSGNYAYVADFDNGLVIVDITNPAAPRLTSNYNTAGHAYGIVVSDNYAYVADAEGGLLIMDTTNPSAPTLAGSYDTGGYVSGVAVSGNYAYLTNENYGLEVVDITNPSAPILKSNYFTDYAHAVAVSGNYVYVATGSNYIAAGYKGLEILDISNPSSPIFVSSYDTAGPTGAVDVSGNYAYLASGGSDSVFVSIVDVTYTSSPTLAGSYSLYADNGIGVTVSGDYAYIGVGFPGLSILDISNPISPRYVGGYGSYGPANYTGAVVVSGNYAYIPKENGLEILDITDPSSPIFVGSYGTAGPTGAVDVSGNYAYVADAEGGLVIVDISNPSAPTLAGSYDTGGYVSGVAVSGNYAYVTSTVYLTNAYQSHFEIVDITNPSSPALAGNYYTAGYAWVVAVSGNYAYVADRNGLSIVDISNPSTPTLAGRYDAGGSISDVAVSGNYVYVAAGENGLVILRVEIPQDKTPPGSVTNLKETGVGSSWIGWAWTSPKDVDFKHVMVYIDGKFVTNTSNEFYNVIGLNKGTTHTISTRTVDSSNNINPTWVNDSATTTVMADTTPPAPVTNLKEIGVGQNWIKWTWVNPTDVDFKHVMVYIDGKFVTNTSNEFYNVIGLDKGTTHTISTRTVDTSNNINPTWVNDSATTTVMANTTPPASVTNLKETGVGSSWIGWTWTNPTDADFKHVMVYLDSVFVTNTSNGFYNATELGSLYISELNVEDEWVKIKNSGSSTVDLTGWRIKDEGDIHTYTVPLFQLKAGATVTLYTGKGSNTGTELYWESDGYVWNNEGDTAYLYNSGGYLVDSLRSGTTHAIKETTHIVSTRTVDTFNNINLTWVNDTATTASTSSGGGGGGSTTTKSSSGGGGGGGAGSAEDYANVAIKDVDSEYLQMNANVTYKFAREGNPVQSVSFYSLKNSGQITSTIEVLNGRSKLVNSGPEGSIYKYVNIWVGKSGFAIAANIKDAWVKFKVSNAWIKDMGVSPEDVKLQRFNGTAWEVLPTTLESNTTGYAIFGARTPGFSPFAITAERAVVSSVTGETGAKPIQTGIVGVEETQSEQSGIWTFILAILIIGVFAVGYEYMKKQQK